MAKMLYFVGSLLLMDIVFGGHKSRDSDSNSVDDMNFPCPSTTALNLTELCNCSNIDFNITNTYKPNKKKKRKHGL